ncbi:MAG TPA: flavodoxin domain-containing protein [Acidothermaceae bacterium]
MRAIVVYESMYGNTRTVAEALGDGLRWVFDTSVVPVEKATVALIKDADLVVVGGPTHVHSMSRASTRTAAADTARAKALTLEASVEGPGLREWFTEVGAHPHAIAVAFDTRVAMPVSVTGRAGRGIARRLRRCKFADVRDAGSFFVDKNNMLLAGEEERAAAWGRSFARDL